MAARSSELYYITSKHNKFYFDFSKLYRLMRFYDCFIARNNIAFSLTAIKELIEEVTPGDWVKCVKHVLSVERVYILV